MHRSPRSWVALATVTATLAVTVVTGLFAGPALAAPSSGAGAVLSADPAGKGFVGLCNEAGQNVTGGSIDARPFVWKAVASTPPPSAYQGHGQNAVLGIFQPRPGTVAVEWGGTSLTAASYYTRKAAPAAQATYADDSLRSVIRRYPPEVDGLYVLRMYFGKAGYANYTATYPTTTIQVTGTTWRVVRGGTVDCHAARAVSNEQLTGVAGAKSTTPRRPSTSERTVDTATSKVISVPAASVRAAADRSTGTSGDHPGINASPAARTTSTSSISWVVWVLVGMVVALLLALSVVVRGRRTITDRAGSNTVPPTS